MKWGTRGLVAQRIKAVGEETVCTSLIVSAELRFGALKKGSEALSSQLEAVLSALDILPLEGPVDEHYAGLRLVLERSGMPIGGNDMLIAAHALAHGLILVTANEREFSRVPGLSVEDWLEPKTVVPAGTPEPSCQGRQVLRKQPESKAAVG